MSGPLAKDSVSTGAEGVGPVAATVGLYGGAGLQIADGSHDHRYRHDGNPIAR